MELLDYFYTENQAAELLKVNRVTIWRWIKDGKVDIQRIGREAIIPKWQIDLIREFKKHDQSIANVQNNFDNQKIIYK